MIGHNNPVLISQGLGQVAVIEGPTRVAVHHHHRITLAFIEIVVLQTIEIKEVICKGIEITHLKIFNQNNG